MLNPFFSSYDKTKIDIKSFTRLLVFCPIANKPCYEILYNKNITDDDLKKITTNYNFHVTTLNILENEKHLRDTIVVKRNILDQFREFEFLENELVLFLPEINFNNAMNYINSLYESNITLTDIDEKLILFDFYSCHNLFKCNSKLYNLIIQQESYWENIKNCDINMTKYFNSRNNTFEDGEFLFDITKPLDISHNYIHSILKSSISDTLKLAIFNTLLLSKKYNYLILKDDGIIDIMKPLVLKNFMAEKYIFSYAWLFMYLHELKNDKNITKEDTYVFTLRTAKALYDFPFNIMDLSSNPYTSILVNHDAINTKDNVMGIPMLINHDYNLYSMIDYKRNMNIFTTGIPNICIFDGLEWNDTYAIFGDINIACAIRSPLLYLCGKINNIDTLKIHYNTSYANSIIYVMCKKTSLIEYMDNINNAYKVIKENFKKIDNDNDIKIKISKKIKMNVSKEYFNNYLKDIIDIYIGVYDENKINEYLEQDIIKQHFHNIYIQKQQKNLKKFTIKKNKQNQFYKYMFSGTKNEIEINIVSKLADDNNICIYSDELDSEQEKKLLMITIEENIDCRLNLPAARTIKFEMIKTDNFMQTIIKQNISCLKCYYDGKDLNMMPSCVTAFKTLININYEPNNPKYDYTILEKYKTLGFSTILNKKELTLAESTGAKLGGYSLLSDERFVSYNSISIELHDYILNNKKLYDLYKLKYDNHDSIIAYDKLNTISKIGTIIPFKKWILMSICDIKP